MNQSLTFTIKQIHSLRNIWVRTFTNFFKLMTEFVTHLLSQESR